MLFMRNRKSTFVFRGRVSKFGENFTEATPIIITLMPMFATSRAKMEHNILFVKIVNRYFERQRHQFRSFDGSSVRIKGEKTLYLSE